MEANYSVDRVTRFAGTNKRSVYSYFNKDCPSKSDNYKI